MVETKPHNASFCKFRENDICALKKGQSETVCNYPQKTDLSCPVAKDSKETRPASALETILSGFVEGA